jgi:cytochrome c oxidase subunit 4
MSESQHIVPLRIYYTVFAALMIFTAVTVGIAYVDLGRLNVVVALTIAVIKATLVILYFMHIRYSTQLTRVVLAAGFFWLLVLILFTMADVVSRGWLGFPGK